MERTGTSRSCPRRLQSNSRWEGLPSGRDRKTGGASPSQSVPDRELLDAGAFGRPSGAGGHGARLSGWHSVRLFPDEMFVDRVCPQLLDDWEWRPQSGEPGYSQTKAAAVAAVAQAPYRRAHQRRAWRRWALSPDQDSPTGRAVHPRPGRRDPIGWRPRCAARPVRRTPPPGQAARPDRPIWVLRLRRPCHPGLPGSSSH